MKPSFLAQLSALPAKDVAHVTEKLGVLAHDPSPDGGSKKRLAHLPGKLYRLRSGDFRILYTYDDRYVSLLAIKRREKDTYDDAPESEFLGGLDVEDPTTSRPEPRWERPAPVAPATRSTPLPQPITKDVLQALHVPAQFYKPLMSVRSQEELLDCPGVPDEVKLRIDQALFETPVERVLDQPDLVVPEVSDLLRFREGSLLGFLLKLDPEQEVFVKKNLAGTGPTLLKGGPGTGKSTVAIYRVREIVRALPRSAKPKILFTTYTNALISFTSQLIEQLLGSDKELVDVRTADHLIRAIVGGDCGKDSILGADEVLDVVRAAVSDSSFDGNPLVQKAQRQAVSRLDVEYLAAEIGGVIEGRGLRTLDEYLAAPRPGRLVPLNSTQRRAVWAVRERMRAILADRRKWTWELLRLRALDKVEAGRWKSPYSAVLVDEAQDLSPVALRLLATVCPDPARLFLTADANQSIYGSGFTWSAVHESLRFKGGRTGVIRTNHRSTREIGEAARSYLSGGVLEESSEETVYEHEGALPAVRSIGSFSGEIALLARYLKEAAREARLATSSGAVLVPSEKTGRPLAESLTRAGVAAEFMPGRELDLRKPVVKVLTLRSAKGLEFPIVGIGGFVGSEGDGRSSATGEWAEETLLRERRTLFVGMTRAMRTLLVLVPDGTANPLLQGFSTDLWNVK